ncbi:MAG: T9SS type A sorting domain-containing protein, partial [Chitinophagaceae bacterium]|nr:T9SS type A sorting domain-containing protein [Chitinophagaceae bacterium]
TNLVQGTYVFRLTVTDNGGATATDDVTVTVNAAANQAPTANAGTDITMTLPANSTTLTGSGTDADGTIASYAWSRVSGPTTFTIGTANAATTTLTNLVQGTYVFRLTVTDNGGATAIDNITVTVNAATVVPNQAPVARTAADSVVLNLPVNSTSLNGSSSTDADGTITSYAWTQLSGPSTAAMANPLTDIAQVTNLATGIYTFQLRVTDNRGASSTKNVRVIVKNKSDDDYYINLFPNPTQGNLTLQYSQNNTGKYRISVYDATRRLIQDGFADKTQVMLTETIHAENLKGGVYIIQIVLPDGKTVSRQFIKV